MKTQAMKSVITTRVRSESRFRWARAGMRGVVLAIAGAAAGLLLQGIAGAQELSSLTVEVDGHYVHIMPTPDEAVNRRSNSPPSGSLNYNGGPVMTKANTYAIFWAPPSLQNSKPTNLSVHYQSVQESFLQRYPGHGIDNNNTQYWEKISSNRYWVLNSGGLIDAYVDTSPYPFSGCNDPYTPGACISDAQIQAEIQKVMSLKGWSGGINNMFLLFTSSGEGSCAGSICAYTDYCAYHSYFGSQANPVIYGNEPYAAAGVCQAGTSPNGDPAADAAASIASHELTEAITDPELNAWYTPSGEEIGDLCAWNYGPNTWDSGGANQAWFTYAIFPVGGIGYYELQQEYDNHTGSCVQVGP